MARLTRFALVTALSAALCFGARVDAAPSNIAHLSYARVFDSTGASFLRTDVAMESTTIISASAFGMDVQLPIFVRTPVPVYDPNDAVHLAANLHRLTIGGLGTTPLITGLTFRLDGARVQMQYQTLSSNASAYSAATTPRAEPPDRTILSLGGPATPAGPLSNVFGTSSFSSAPTFSYASQTPLGDPAGLGFAPYSAPQTIARQLTVPMRVGRMYFTSNVQGSAVPSQSTSSSSFDAMQQCGTADPNAACTAFRSQDNRIAAGTSFNVRAGARRLNVAVSGSVEQQSLPQDTSLPYLPLDPQSPGASTQAAALGGQTAVSYPNAVDVTKHGINANVAVPVTRHVTVNLGYDTQHFQGDYNAAAQTGLASALVPGIDARKDTYLGNITYQLPHTNSAITFYARQYRYQDNFQPDLNLTQTRADVNFTVKF